jgi:DNA polymerase-3 subunit gamma/tau
MSQVLALKYRPRTFDEVVGQKTVTTTLKNAIASGRIGHAFLLSGARGVGKTTTARILAKALNCRRDQGPTAEPCLTCESCREIAEGSCLDVLEIDGATNTSVNDVRELRESARYRPARDRFKIWIIDEVHMLSAAAFNALLKTLEEPPPQVKFIFATTEYHKIPDTILSRCQQYDFRLIPARGLAAHLKTVAEKEGIQVSERAVAALARAAEGSVRDALSLFDQLLAFSASGREVKDEDIPALLGLVDHQLLLDASKAVAAGDNVALLTLVDHLSDYGADYQNFTKELMLHLREILLARLAGAEGPLLASVPAEERKELEALAEQFSEEDLIRFIEILTEAGRRLSSQATPDPRVTLELALLKMVQLRRLVPFAELTERVERLIASGGLPSAGGTAARAAQATEPPRDPRPAPPRAARSEAPAAEPVGATGQGDLAAAMLAACQGRPSVAQPLRGATARLSGDTLVLEVPQTFGAFAELHLEEYRELAAKVVGRPVKLRLATSQGPAEAPAPPSVAELRRQRLRQEAEQDPAVRETIDLFEGRLLDVKEDES